MAWLLRLLSTEPTRSPVPLAEDAARVFAAAVRAARRRGSECVGTGHLLVGIADAGSTPAREALTRAGIDPRAVRAGCEFVPGAGVSGPRDPLALTQHAEGALAAAWREAERSGSPGVGSIGLLLALAQGEDGVARGLLRRLVANEPRVSGAGGGA